MSVEHLEEFKWKAGQPSANPNGRPKGLARATREMVGEDGNALAELWWSIANDETRRDSDRLEASKLLAERGWGKAVTFNPIEGDPLGFDGLEQAAEEFRSNILRLAPAGDEGAPDRAGDTSEPDES
jgi:hypothetical protein